MDPSESQGSLVDDDSALEPHLSSWATAAPLRAHVDLYLGGAGMLGEQLCQLPGLHGDGHRSTSRRETDLVMGF